MQHSFPILGTDYMVDFDYRVTCKAQPATGPSYSCGGTPAEPMEYEITLNSITFDDDRRWAAEIPQWLREQIVEHLQSDDAIYQKIERDC